jgi:glycosyltransferase involved in cell wall biosynthesis
MTLVGVDAVPIGARVTGAARVLVNLLARLPEADPELEYVAFVTPAGEETVRSRAPNVSFRTVAPRSGLKWELRGAGEAAAAAGADLLFTVRELVPLDGPPTLVHVFEPPAYRLRTFGAPSAAEARRYAKDVVLHLAFRRSLRRARRVTAGSRTTGAWLRAHARVEADVVLPGIDPVFLESEPRLPDDPPYVFHLASGDPRDNTELVLQAARGLRLVVAGAPEQRRNRIARRAAELRVDLELTGWVSDERLRELYRGAIALAHPTKYEAYAGLPVLEAMALGTPAVVLDAPGATEAVEGVGIVVPREDPRLLADAFARLRDDPKLRAELSARGRRHAEALTWEASAAGFAAAFRKALALPPSPRGT